MVYFQFIQTSMISDNISWCNTAPGAEENVIGLKHMVHVISFQKLGSGDILTALAQGP